MASRAFIVDGLMREAGKTSPKVRGLIDLKVGEITLELLSQNSGRFRGLEKTQAISVVANTQQYLLNADFFTAKKSFHQVDGDGNFMARLSIVSKTELFDRKSAKAYSGIALAYIEFLEYGPNGRGFYLHLGTDPTGTATYHLDYYREPTTADTDLIRKVTILQHGVRASLPQYFVNAEYEAAIYIRRLQGFKESPDTHITDAVVTPNPRIAKHNQRMHDIGQGK